MKKVPKSFWSLIVLFFVLVLVRNPGAAKSATPLPGLDIISFERCPVIGCTELDLAKLAEIVGMPDDPLDIVLFYNGRQVAALGKASKNARLPNLVKITMPVDPLDAIARGNGFAAGFQLRLLNGAGQVVLKKNIALKLR